MKITINGTIIGRHYDFMPEGAISWSFDKGYDATAGQDEDRVHSQPHSVEAEVPDDINLVAAQVSALEAAKLRALDAYHAEVAKLNERLSKLLAITNEVAA